MVPDSNHHASSSFEGDFGPGHVLIGRYRVVALIGEGAMGQVYLADDLVLGQPVAVKFLPARTANDPDALERFRAEVRHARDVTHPNVARVHDIGEVRLRDASVGRELLVGLFVGFAVLGVTGIVAWGADLAGLPMTQVAAMATVGLDSPLAALSHVVHLFGDVVMITGVLVFTLLVLRALVRVAWLGNGLMLALVMALPTAGLPGNHVMVFGAGLGGAACLLLLTRLGFLSVLGFLAAVTTTNSVPLTLNSGDWYFGSSLAAYAAVGALGIWGYRTAVAGKSVFD